MIKHLNAAICHGAMLGTQGPHDAARHTPAIQMQSTDQLELASVHLIGTNWSHAQCSVCVTTCFTIADQCMQLVSQHQSLCCPAWPCSFHNSLDATLSPPAQPGMCKRRLQVQSSHITPEHYACHLVSRPTTGTPTIDASCLPTVQVSPVHGPHTGGDDCWRWNLRHGQK